MIFGWFEIILFSEFTSRVNVHHISHKEAVYIIFKYKIYEIVS